MMKMGKTSITITRRSILKQLGSRREEALIQPSLYESCAGIKVAEGQDIIASEATLFGSQKELGIYAMIQAVNQIVVRGAQPIGVMVRILLSSHAHESRLKAMVGHLEAAASGQNLEILLAEAEVVPVISSTIVTVTALGTVAGGKDFTTDKDKQRRDLVLTKWIGLDGTLRILGEKHGQLEQRFVPAFLQRIEQWSGELAVMQEVGIARQSGATTIRQVGEGGIFAALWAMSEEMGAGIEVELNKITIRQETVEICEFFRLNPYLLSSAGSTLIAADDGGALVDQLSAEGICAAVIGHTTAKREKVIINGEDKRFLDRPAPDEILKLYNLEEKENHD